MYTHIHTYIYITDIWRRTLWEMSPLNKKVKLILVLEPDKKLLLFLNTD